MTCKFCGAELPENAVFCPVCARSLIEKTEIPVPKPRRKKLLTVCALAVLLIAAAAGILMRGERPAVKMVVDDRQKLKEGFGMVTLDDADGHYEVALCSDGSGLPNKSFEIMLFDSRGTAEVACQLMVTKDGEPANEAFLKKLDSISMEIIDAAGAPMTVTEPAASDDHPNAAMVSVVAADLASESAVLQCRGTLKNGIKFTIRQKLSVNVVPVLRYFAEDYPMGTDEELDILLTEIKETTPDNAMILLFLPAVTYEKSHTFADRSYQVLGNIEGDEVTTFLAPVIFSTEKNAQTDIQNAVLLGNGSGAAVTTNNATTLYFCTVTGWETGVETTGSGSINLQDCVFADNQTAVRWNSERLYNYYEVNPRNTFNDNGTVLELQQVPAALDMKFSDCIFSGNKLEVDNHTGIEVDLTGSAMS